VWDRVSVFAHVPRTTDNFRLYSPGEGRRGDPFDEYRAIVLPGDANLEGLNYGVNAAVALLNAYPALVNHDPGAAERFKAAFPKIVGDPTRNPYFVAVVSGAMGAMDAEEMAKHNASLPTGVGEALNRFGGAVAASGLPVTVEGEGGGLSATEAKRYYMPAFTAAVLELANVMPFVNAAGTAENVYRIATATPALGKADDQWKWDVLAMTTGQKSNVYSLYAQQRRQDYQADQRIQAVTEEVKKARPLLPTDAARLTGQPAYPPGTPMPMQPIEAPVEKPANPWQPFFDVRGNDSPTLSFDALDAYYNEGPGEFERMSNNVMRHAQKGLSQDTSESFVLWYWASKRALAGIPAEKSGLGAYYRFAPVYQQMLQQGVSREEDEKFVLQLDYPGAPQ